MHPDLALVVDGAAGVEVAIADLRFERGRAPLVERIDRLDVVVAVDERCRERGIHEALRVHRGVPRRLEDLGMVESHLSSLSREVLRVAPDVGRVGGIGRDARDPERLDELVDVALLVGGAVGVEIGVRHGDSLRRRPLRLHPL